MTWPKALPKKPLYLPYGANWSIELGEAPEFADRVYWLRVDSGKEYELREFFTDSQGTIRPRNDDERLWLTGRTGHLEIRIFNSYIGQVPYEDDMLVFVDGNGCQTRVIEVIIQGRASRNDANYDYEILGNFYNL
jgi:hypothetical protein